MTDSASIERDVKAAYQEFIDLFNSKDVAEIIECFAYPYVIVTGAQGLITVTSAADHQIWHDLLMNGLDQRGWGQSVIDLMQVSLFSDLIAQLSVAVTRCKRDGSLLEKIRATYFLRRENERWKIIAIIPIESPFTGSMR